MLRECRGLHGDLEVMGEREGQLADVLQTEVWSQQVKHLSRRTEELQQSAKSRLQNLQDAAKVNTFRLKNVIFGILIGPKCVNYNNMINNL